MIRLYFIDTLDGQGHFACISELHVKFDKVLELLVVMREFHWLCLDIKYFHIMASFAVTSAMRPAQSVFYFFGFGQLRSGLGQGCFFILAHQFNYWQGLRLLHLFQRQVRLLIVRV